MSGKRFIILAAIAIMLFGCEKSEAPRESAGVTNATRESKNSAETKTGNSTGDIMDSAIGTRVQYFESLYGPAIKVLGDPDRRSAMHQRSYHIRGCNFSLTEQSGDIIGVSIMSAATCSAKITIPGIEGKKKVGDIKFGDLSDADFSVDCLSSCGNASDPSVYATYQGSHAENFQTVTFETVIVAEDASKAQEKWRGALEAIHGDDYVVSGGYKCNNSDKQTGSGLFRNVKVQEITIGTHFGPTGAECDKNAARSDVVEPAQRLGLDIGNVTDSDSERGLAAVKNQAWYCSLKTAGGEQKFVGINETGMIRLDGAAYLVEQSKTAMHEPQKYINRVSDIVVTMKALGPDSGPEGQPDILTEMTILHGGRSSKIVGQETCGD